MNRAPLALLAAGVVVLIAQLQLWSVYEPPAAPLAPVAGDASLCRLAETQGKFMTCAE